jgi:predicted deacylase
VTVIVPPCAVVTTPVDGRVERLADPGTAVHAGDVVAVVHGSSGRRELVSAVRGLIGGALAAPTQAVTAGEAVLWLSRR